MLNIPRLRIVLKKLETSSDLAKFLIQRATAVAATINKEYGAAASATAVEMENPPNVTSPSVIVTSQSKSVPPPSTTDTHSTHTFANSPTDSPAAAATETEQENHQQQQKTITAALTAVSLFSRTESNGGAAKLVAGDSNLREQILFQGYYDDGDNDQKNHNKITAKQKQPTNKMSEVKVEEVIKQTADAVPQLNHQLGEKSTCNGSSCGSGADSQNQNSSVKEKPCFKSSLADIIHFMELVGNLKHTKRTGWVLRDVNDCESISGHMYRMSMMTFLLDGSEGLNQIRCMELALVHDLAESLVGDLTPFCGVAKEDKKAMELKAMEDICKLIEPRGKRIMELFVEYEGGESAESRFVKDLDRLDLVMQAFEYEKRDNCLMKHQEFFDSTEGKFQHPFVQKLVKEICDQRKALVEAKVIANGNLKLKTVTPNCPPCLEHKNARS